MPDQASTSDSAEEVEPATSDSPRLFETGRRSDTVVFAIPLFLSHPSRAVEYVYLPIQAPAPAQQTSPKPNKMWEFVAKTQQVFTDMWERWSNHSERDLRRKIHDSVTRHMEQLNTKEARLVQGLSLGTRRIIVVYPSCEKQSTIHKQITSIVGTRGRDEYLGLAAACVGMPVACLLDSLLIIGPPILSSYAGFRAYNHYRGIVGSHKLQRLVRKYEQSGCPDLTLGIEGWQDDDDNDDLSTEHQTPSSQAERDMIDKGMVYIPCDDMVEFVDAVQNSPEGVLAHEDIQQLCARLGRPELASGLEQLRNLHTRQKQERMKKIAKKGPISTEMAVIVSGKACQPKDE